MLVPLQFVRQLRESHNEKVGSIMQRKAKRIRHQDCCIRQLWHLFSMCSRQHTCFANIKGRVAEIFKQRVVPTCCACCSNICKPLHERAAFADAALHFVAWPLCTRLHIQQERSYHPFSDMIQGERMAQCTTDAGGLPWLCVCSCCSRLKFVGKKMSAEPFGASMLA